MRSEINKLCSACRQHCKQAASAKIIFCPMFEARRSDLKGQGGEGNGNVSTPSKTAIRLTCGENSV